ncbi:MAG: sigma-70 family RNA polymerase sigma factor, partial [Solirubrobacterales bacterium]|nr:sigma-70 family RNA polymerase sigma factor [Solirubrobacterales bacterium]MBV9472825.1 sigma-70 family RNA polymerase sigma factor [Solirubrobacterales bacterium]
WVLGVVRNRTIDSFRQREIKQGRDVGDDTAAERIPAGERTDVEAARREEASAVRSALDGLVRDQRLVIELAYFGGFTHSQIAEMLELPAGTVKGRMRLGLAKLRLALGDPAEVVR